MTRIQREFILWPGTRRKWLHKRRLVIQVTYTLVVIVIDWLLLLPLLKHITH